jgi:hypothetical protein
LHQGPDAWKVSTRFEALYDLPPEIAAALLPFLPKFQHAMLDLSQYDPAAEEEDPQMRIILNLMKLARERELVRFFEWLAQSVVFQLPDSLLGSLLLYALHADSELDSEQIYRSLTGNHNLRREPCPSPKN